MIVFNGRTELLYLVKHVSQYYRNYTTATIEPLYTSLEFLLSKLCPIFLPSHWLLPHIAFDKTVITREEINCKSTLPFSQISTDCQKKKKLCCEWKILAGLGNFVFSSVFLNLRVKHTQWYDDCHFQHYFSYHSHQCTYPYFLGVSYTISPHSILYKLLAAFPLKWMSKTTVRGKREMKADAVTNKSVISLWKDNGLSRD